MRELGGRSQFLSPRPPIRRPGPLDDPAPHLLCAELAIDHGLHVRQELWAGLMALDARAGQGLLQAHAALGQGARAGPHRQMRVRPPRPCRRN